LTAVLRGGATEAPHVRGESTQCRAGAIDPCAVSVKPAHRRGLRW
jgi:hypothetical protein